MLIHACQLRLSRLIATRIRFVAMVLPLLAPFAVGCSSSDASSDGAKPLRVPDQHRPAPVACTERTPGSTVDATPDGGPPCVGTNATWITTPGGMNDHCAIDQCFQDDDCKNDGGVAVCDCTGNRNQCLPHANCRTDADCGAGGFCSYSVGRSGQLGYFCHTAADECVSGSDCAPTASPDACEYSYEGRWVCGHWSPDWSPY